MATLRLFIWLSQDLAEIDEDVQTTVEETLLKHLESPHTDLVFASLYHLASILEKSGRLLHSGPQHLTAILCKYVLLINCRGPCNSTRHCSVY